MKLKHILVGGLVILLAVTCKQLGEITPVNIRQEQPKEASGFHEAVTIQVGWFPYEELKLTKTGDHEWRVVANDQPGKTGLVPHILITYPESKDSLWIDLNIDNELLGKLIKHTVMTQQHIAKPFRQYFEEAKCSKCHPDDIQIN